VTGLSAVEKMVELSRRRICCQIDDYKFDLAIQEIVETAKPHLIIIESTGLRRIRSVGVPSEGGRARLDAVITVVDAANFDRQTSTSALVAAPGRGRRLLDAEQADLVDEGAATRLSVGSPAERQGGAAGLDTAAPVDSELLSRSRGGDYRAPARGPDHVHETASTACSTSTAAARQDAFDAYLRRLRATSCAPGHRHVRRDAIGRAVRTLAASTTVMTRPRPSPAAFTRYANGSGSASPVDSMMIRCGLPSRRSPGSRGRTVVVDLAADAAARQLDHLLDRAETRHDATVDPTSPISFMTTATGLPFNRGRARGGAASSCRCQEPREMSTATAAIPVLSRAGGRQAVRIGWSIDEVGLGKCRRWRRRATRPKRCRRAGVDSTKMPCQSWWPRRTVSFSKV